MKKSNSRKSTALGSIKLRTVTGILHAKSVEMALAHEHMFTDFSGPDQDAYMDVNWSNKIGAAVESGIGLVRVVVVRAIVAGVADIVSVEVVLAWVGDIRLGQRVVAIVIVEAGVKR